MIDCTCSDRFVEGCARPDHDVKLVVVRCDQCGAQKSAWRRLCRCGSLYGTFVSYTTLGLSW